MQIITAIHSLGLHHTEPACLCDSSQRNYRLNHLKPSTARSDPMFNFTFDSSPPFFPHCHLSTPPIQPTHTFTAEFHSRANLSRTTIHFQSCRVVGWMAIDDSILGMKLESPFGIDSPPVVCGCAWCPFCFPLCPPPPATCYPRPGRLTTANFSACMETWVRWMPQIT